MSWIHQVNSCHHETAACFVRKVTAALQKDEVVFAQNT
jgi:hypothetical protein